MPTKVFVKEMFDSIAPRYDFLNHFLSFGIDRYWRKKAIGILSDLLAPSYAGNPGRILDVATGTGDLAIEAARRFPSATIVGVDLSEQMISVAVKKVTACGLSGNISFCLADSEGLPFPDSSFDAVIVAFGVRNFENLSTGLHEMKRVLKTGGGIAILEFSKPGLFPVKQIFSLYFRYILPSLGRLISKNAVAYSYLPQSVSAFPEGGGFIALLKKAGFHDTKYTPFTFGITSLYTGTK